MSFLNRFGLVFFSVLMLTVSINGHGSALSAVAKAQKAAKAAKAGAVATEAAKVTAVTGHTASVLGRVGACVARRSKTAPRSAAEKSCYQKYEDCIKKTGKGGDTAEINDHCVGVVNKK